MADSLNIKIGIDEPNYIKSIAGATAHFNSQFANKHKINLGVDSKGMSRALGQITGNVKDFESSLAASNARVIAFGASTAIIGGVIRSFQELANATIEVEKSMIDVNRVFGLTSSGLQKLTSDLFEVSKATASSFKDSSKALLEFSRQGVSAADALQRTKDALTLTRLAGVSTEAAVESLTATVNGFSNAGLTTTQVLNKLVAVEQNYAVGAGDLAEALARTGQAAQEAGVDLDQLNALVTSAQQNTARGGAVIGNALKTIFTRVQRAGTLEQLENFNVVVRDLEGNVLPAVQILRNFASVYKDLGTSQKSQLSEQIAGVYQVNILKALIKDLNSETSIYDTALRTGADATNEAEIATAKLNSTMSALLSRVGTGTTQLASNIGNVTFEPLARTAATAVEDILNVFNTALEGDGVGNFFANGFLKGMRNVLGGPVALGLSAVLYKVASTSFTYLSEVIPKLIGITTETSKRRLLEENVLAIMQQQGNVANAILGAQGNQAAQVAIIVNEARLLTQEYQKQVALSKQLAPLLSQQGLSVGKRGIETTRSGGFIPDSVRNAEIQGAFQGGYIPGKVIKSPVGGVMNSAETVKHFAGFSQPFINPPANSKAGMKHKEASMRKTGINPYSFDGFLPNFANPKFVQNIVNSYKASLTEKDSVRSAQAKKAQSYYQIVNSELTNLSKSSGHSLEKLAYGLAALSGNTSDLEARKGLERIVKNESYDDLAILPKNVEKVKKMLGSSGSSDELMSILGKGAKTQNFAQSLLLSEKFSGFGKYKNPLNTPSVMDSWAIYVRNGGALKDKYDRKAVTDKQKSKLFSQSTAGYKYYNTLVKEYGGAAQILGIPVGELQARTWGWARGQVGSVTRNSFASGFVPNFAYKNSVMGLEQKISGEKAIYSDNPFPHVRNSSQPTFGSAIADHGGLNNAIRDSISGQKSVGLLNSGFIPNFAGGGVPNQSDFSLIGTELVGQSGKFVSHQKIGQSISNYIKSLDLASLSNFEINNQIRSLIGNYKLNAASFAEVTKQSFAFAKAEKEARKQISAVKFGGQYGIEDNVIFGGAVNRGFVKQNVSGFPLGSQSSLGVPGFSGAPNFGNNIFKGSVSGAIQSAGIPSFANESVISKVLSGSIFSGPQVGIARQASLGLFNNVGGLLGQGSLSSPTLSNTSKYKQFNSNLSQGTVSGAIGSQFSGESNLKGAAATSPINKKAIVETFASGFYSPDVSIALQKEIEKGAKANKKTILEKINSPGLGLGLALGAPVLGGFVEQAVFGNKRRSELSETERGFKSAAGFGISSIATGALVGSSFGPVGTGVGAGAGALLALITAINNTSLSFEELVQSADEFRAKNQEQSNAAKEYIRLVQQSFTLTDPDAIERSSLDIRDAFAAIKDVKLHESFEKAGTDINKLTTSLFDFDREKRKQGSLEAEVAKAKLFSDIGDDTKRLEKEFQFRTKTTEPTVGQDFGFGASVTPGISSLEKGARTKARIFSDFPSLFENLDKLNAVNAIALQEAFKDQRKSLFFDSQRIKSILDEGGVEKNQQDSIVATLKNLADAKNLVGKEISEELYKYLSDFRKQAAKKSSGDQESNLARNQFNQFRLFLNKSIFDELEQVSRIAKVFEFDSSIQTMVTEKMREIGDGIFSSLLTNASELGQLSIKQSQIQFNSQIQSRQIGESLEKVRGETSYKRKAAEAKLQSDLVALIPQTISKSGAGINQISELLEKAKNGELFGRDIQSSLNEMFGINKDNFSYDTFVGTDNQTQELFLKIQSLVNEYDALALASERELATEKLKANYARTINELSSKTAEQQLNTEKKRLAISIAQKEAINRLTAETGGAKIAGTTSLELEKIKQGGEFRYLGMNKKEEFVAQQADQQRIFQLEQSLEKDKILAEARQSAIEIAAQNANTEALNENTRSNLESTKKFLEGKLSDPYVSEQEKTSYSALFDQNEESIKGFQARTDFGKANLFPSGDKKYASIEEAIADFREKAAKEGLDPNIKAALESQIVQLEQAAQQIESSVTIVAERSKQAASDFQRSSGFVNNMGIGFNQLSRSADDIVDKLGRDVPSMFADGISNAIARGITGAQKIGDALKDSAISFGQQIISDLLKASLYRTLGATGIGSLLGAKQKGGVITAQNGMYISGGRTGDKNMALLEDGEYVLNRNAVKAAGGKGVLDQFNFKQAPRFATGGGFGTQAEMKYLRPKGKDEGYDFTDNVLSGNTSQSINADNYSAYAYENDQYFVKKREQAVQDLAEKVQRDFVKKQKNAALISSIVGAVGSGFLAVGTSKLAQQAALGKQIAQADGLGLTATTAQAQASLVGVGKGGLSYSQLGKFASQNPGAFQLNGISLNTLAGAKNGLFGMNKLSNLSGVLNKSGFSSLKGSGFSLLNQGVSEGVGLARRGRQDGGLIGLNGGGYLPHGSRLGDTIPALLTGGEYVMNNSAVKKYGISKMNEINNGSMKDGGSSSTSNTNNNSATISINIDRSGKSVVGATNSSYEKQDLILTKDMARSIHAVVLKTMSNEKRYGGELYKNPLRS